MHVSNHYAAESCLVLAAVLGLGAIYVPLNPRAGSHDLSRLVELTDPKVVITSAPTLAALTPSRGGKRAVWDVRALRGIMLGYAPATLSDVSPEADAAILCTSGTTGAPKGAVYTHEGLCRVAERTVVASLGPEADLPLLGPGDVFQTPVPLYTSSGPMNVMIPILYQGYTGPIQSTFDAQDTLRLADARRTSALFAVPAMIALMVEVAGKGSLSDLRCLLTGAAPTPAELLQRTESLWPEVSIVNTYGSTEAGGAMTVTFGPTLRAHPGAAGFPMAGYAVRLITEFTDGDTDGVGSVQVRGPGVMREFFSNPEATAETISDEGWGTVGDLGRMDGGLLCLAGRKHDMIIRGGFNIMPREAEATLEGHPRVLEAGVVGTQHAILGEDLVAFVVLRPAAEGISDGELRTYCLERLSDYQVPRQIRVVHDPLPRNPHGKLTRTELAGWLS